MAISQALNRRQLAKGAVWSAPVVLATASVPAYAASVPQITYSVKNGAFVQVVNSNPGDIYSTILGVSSYDGGSSTPDGNTPLNGAEIASAGTFTPGGSIDVDNYGGAGFWVSTPFQEQTGEYVAGATTTLPSGLSFSMTYTVRFAEADFAYEPLLWIDNKVEKVVGSAATGNGANRNEVPFTATFGVGNLNGDTWTGVVTYTTTQDVVLLHSSADPFVQILASHVPVTYDVSAMISSFTARISVDPIMANMTVNGETESKVIPSQTETATLILEG